jgi:outer membrane cobalamin receptor
MNVEDSLANFLYEYNEQIYSVYAVYGQQINRVKFQGGLRAENAYQIPNLVTDSIRIVNHYINFFPSAHLRYVLKPKSELSLSYSRRITRAASADVNPFTNYSDPFNLRTGNPYLQPEFIHSFDLGYSLEKAKYSITASTYYRNSTGVISRVKEFYENGTSAVTFMNIAETKSLGTEFVCMFRPTTWWKNTFSYNANYIWYITNQVDLPNRQGFNHNFKYNTSVEFWKKTATLQLSVTYNGPRVTVQGIAQRQGPIDLAFEKKLQGGKWSVGARVTDIFNKQGFYMQVDRPGVSQTAEFKWLTRRLYFSASYKFGKLEMSNKSKLPGAEGGAE